MHGEDEKCYKILVGKPERKWPLETPRHKWKDNIKCVLKRQGMRMKTGFIWLRIGSSGRLLWRWWLYRSWCFRSKWTW